MSMGWSNGLTGSQAPRANMDLARGHMVCSGDTISPDDTLYYMRPMIGTVIELPMIHASKRHDYTGNQTREE